MTQANRIFNFARAFFFCIATLACVGSASAQASALYLDRKLTLEQCITALLSPVRKPAKPGPPLTKEIATTWIFLGIRTTL